MLDGTRKFNLVDESDKEMKRTLITVYDALKEKGPKGELGISDELMQELVQRYLDT